jgi:site-specific DNA-methyltransferase (adenine-specific)
MVKSTIIEGDALEEMAELQGAEFKAIITDPPYCSGGRAENEKMRGDVSMRREVDPEDWFNGDSMTVGTYQWFLRKCALEWNRLLEVGGSVFVFTDWRMQNYVRESVESAGFTTENLIVWDKDHFGMGSGFRYQHEFILQFTKGKFEAAELDRGNVLTYKRCSDDVHPTQKPVPLLEDLLRVSAEKGDAVLDPFAGSGSTGVAAIQRGLSFTGIERDPEHAETARNRLTNSHQQQRIE